MKNMNCMNFLGFQNEFIPFVGRKRFNEQKFRDPAYIRKSITISNYRARVAGGSARSSSVNRPMSGKVKRFQNSRAGGTSGRLSEERSRDSALCQEKWNDFKIIAPALPVYHT